MSCSVFSVLYCRRSLIPCSDWHVSVKTDVILTSFGSCVQRDEGTWQKAFPSTLEKGKGRSEDPKTLLRPLSMPNYNCRVVSSSPLDCSAIAILIVPFLWLQIHSLTYIDPHQTNLKTFLLPAMSSLLGDLFYLAWDPGFIQRMAHGHSG